MKTLISIITLLLLFVACTETDTNGQTQFLDPNTIEQGGYRRDALTSEQLATIDTLHRIFGEADAFTKEAWVDNMRRDLDPDRELGIFMDMARAYEQFTTGRSLSAEAKKEAYKVVLMRSMSSPEEVKARLDLSHLTLADADTLMSYMEIEPQPVRVVAE